MSALGDAFVDFHGQHEHQTLLKPSVQLDVLDRFGGHENESEAVAQAYERWSAVKAEMESSQMSEEERRPASRRRAFSCRSSTRPISR